MKKILIFLLLLIPIIAEAQSDTTPPVYLNSRIVRIGKGITSSDFLKFKLFNDSTQIYGREIISIWPIKRLKFWDGTTQTTAFTSALGSKWTLFGSGIYNTDTTKNVSIRTKKCLGALTVKENSRVTFGKDSTGVNGYYFLWNGKKGSLYVGYSNINAAFLIGENSVNLGGESNVINGYGNFGTGAGNWIDTTGNPATVNYNALFGYGNYVNASLTFGIGKENYLLADHTNVFGRGLIAKSYGTTLFGYNNDTTGAGVLSKTSYQAGGILFQIGCGVFAGGPVTRENAVSITNNGTFSFKNYTMPLADGISNQVLRTNGSSIASWGSVTGLLDSTHCWSNWFTSVLTPCSDLFIPGGLRDSTSQFELYNLNDSSGIKMTLSNRTWQWKLKPTGLSFTTGANIVPFSIDSAGNYDGIYLKLNDSVTSVGINSLVSNTTGTDNTGVGVYSLFANTTGTKNTAIGDNALHEGDTAYNCTGVGFNALKSNLASENTATGAGAMQFNTTGHHNVAMGTALENNVSGNYNTACGFKAVHFNTTGNGNTGVGNYSLYGGTSGWGNSALGDSALYNCVTGFKNIGVGWRVRLKSSSDTNSNNIGGNGKGSNTNVFGNPASTLTWLGGSLAVGTSAAGTSIDSVQIIENGVFKSVDMTKAYGTMGFSDSSNTIAMTLDTYYVVPFYNTGVTNGVTFVGDSTTVLPAGDYEIKWDLSAAGTNISVFHVSVFVNGIEQMGKGEGICSMTITGEINMSGHTILTLAANSNVTIRVKNVANNDDIVVQAGNLVIHKI